MLVNLTPHAVSLRLPSGEILRLESQGVARVATLPAESSEVKGLPVPVLPSPAFGPVEGLPGPVEGTSFVVSGLVLAHCGGRRDVFAPATGPSDGAERNEKGHVTAVTRLVAAPL